jgi:hypothetical protein
LAAGIIIFINEHNTQTAGLCVQRCPRTCRACTHDQQIDFVQC